VGTILTGRSRPPPASLAWLVWGLGAALYLVAFYQRVAPAVITRELSLDFGLSAAALGNLSAFYFYSYVAVQIPTGLLADRWGPRRVLAVGAALTAAGTLVFALAPSVAWASAGRLAIGAAGGVAFVSMLKLATHWMPPKRFAFVSGVALFTGVLGATLAGAPLRALVDAFGWRAVMGASAALSALAAAAIWVVVRDDPRDRGYESYFPTEPHGDVASVATHLREVLGYRNVWLLFFSTSERMGRRKPLFLGGLGVTLALWSAVIFVPGLPRGVLLALLIGVSVASATFILNFAFAKESVPAHLGGTVSGIANMGVMLGGMFMQPLVGVVLDRHWGGAMADGVRLYDFEAFRAGFSLMLAWGALALVLVAFARETHCRRALTPP
jgi:MFS family permease